MTTYGQRPLEVKLIRHTKDPVGLMAEVWNRARDLPITRDRSKEVEIFRKLIFEFTPIPEMIHFTWWIDGASRAFYDQITRHRRTAWFTKSLRIQGVSGFSTRGDYLTTPRVAVNPRASDAYKRAMLACDQAYMDILSAGVPMEDARGVLPIGLRVALTWNLTLRDMVDVFSKRSCHLLQQEYWAHLAVKMKRELESIDEELGVIFQPPCMRPQPKCLTPLEAEEKVHGVLHSGAIARRDLHPCRIYTQTWTHPTDRKAVERLIREGVIDWAKTPEEVVNG